MSVLRYRGVKSTLVTPDELQKQFGITPAQYADFKSLVGDNADNIKGAEKVGPKTAALLLKQFGTLEDILNNADKIERLPIKTAVMQSTERLRTNYKLIKLTLGAPLPFTLDKLTLPPLPFSTNETLKSIGLLP